MIKTMNRRSTTCSDRGLLRCQRARDGALAALAPALKGGAFSAILTGMAVFGSAAWAAPADIRTDFGDTDILVTLPQPALTRAPLPDNAEELADTIQQQILQARRDGDPRYLGYASGLLSQWPENRLTDRLRVLRATVQQSLHQFDDARADLQTVITTANDPAQKRQARLTLANLELVQGRYEQAAAQCQALIESSPGLVADSCQAQVEGRTGQPEQAYQRLQELTFTNSRAGSTERLWAEGTLADLAAQLGDARARNHWQFILSQQPDDLYTRARLADWFLDNDQPDNTLALTEGYEHVDSLAVIQTIAMLQTNHPQATAMITRLKERFSEARWRGSLLHERDLARFQLDVEGQPQQALSHALANWQDQREPEDTRLVLRASIAAGEEEPANTVRNWLNQHRQTDSRFPEADS
ncbi:tetratricopeptide repeat protein [Marinobacter alkaliphilus]|uniref:Tetratricopeptide repeat protein n=1 Tax=Marinobacter alkaliphilus TaxID=254719 RepID=A0ABZ3E3D8_9GAMM